MGYLVTHIFIKLHRGIMFAFGLNFCLASVYLKSLLEIIIFLLIPLYPLLGAPFVKEKYFSLFWYGRVKYAEFSGAVTHSRISVIAA